MRLDTFESRIEFQARLKPASTAAGLIAYGLYCLVDARYRDVSMST